MSNNSFRFSQKIVGQERKAIASVIHEGSASDLEDVNFTYFLININNDTAYSHYKLEIPAAEAADVMQISEFILVQKDGAAEAPAETPAEEPAAEEPAEAPAEQPQVIAPATSDFATVASFAALALAGVVGTIASKKRSK